MSPIPPSHKRFWLVLTLVLVLDVAVVAVAKNGVRLKRHRTASTYYTRYAGTPGIDAAYVKDYRLNDTLTLDVTILQAGTPALWDSLTTYFRLPAEITNGDFAPDIDNWMKSIVRDHPEQNLCYDSTQPASIPDIAIFSLHDHKIKIFHCQSLSDYYAISDNIYF